MRIRAIVLVCVVAFGWVSSLPSHADPLGVSPVVLAAGPLQPPGGFSESGMHPVFDGCSLPSFSSPTATTNVVFEIRHGSHSAYFQITNSCGTYDESFGLAECDRDGRGVWTCAHTRPDGFYAIASYGVFNGVPHVDATEYKLNPLRFWEVDGYVLVSDD